MLKPGQPIPDLQIDLIDGTRWSIASRPVRTLAMVSIFRGSFCRFCRRFLTDIERLSGAFAERGIDIVATSADSADVAHAMATELGLQQVATGHSLDLDMVARNGVFISQVERDGQRRRFAEPSLWLVRPDGRLYAIFQGSMSCARPNLDSLLEGIDMIAPAGFPARGDI